MNKEERLLILLVVIVFCMTIWFCVYNFNTPDNTIQQDVNDSCTCKCHTETIYVDVDDMAQEDWEAYTIKQNEK